MLLLNQASGTHVAANNCQLSRALSGEQSLPREIGLAHAVGAEGEKAATGSYNTRVFMSSGEPLLRCQASAAG